MPKFRIEQLALYPPDPAAAIALLTAMGAGDWAHDHVVAQGRVFGEPGVNEADLAFNYGAFAGKELEVLHYTDGPNWVNESRLVGTAHNLLPCTVSHIGMHCSAEELTEWRNFFSARGIGVAQEVNTLNHTNPVIAGQRWYNYVIFDTRAILGVDVKFIVRKDHP